MVKITNISKSYEKNNALIPILSHVTMALYPGEFTAVQGPSGCGKSTLLLTIGGLLKPQEGSVFIDNKDVYSLRDRERTTFRSDKIGFIFQEFYLIPYLSVLENIVVAASGQQNKEDVLKRAWELINRFYINHRATHLPETLSTGEKQRTALCRALINDPKVILADEPTGNLDAENAGNLCDCFDAFVKDGGTIFMVTHDSSIAARASRRLFMENGTVVN
jgi:ABC-type lipoprotein export system ATPase subunit